MTDDEFERAKAEEKQRLRAQRTLRKLKQALSDHQKALSSHSALEEMRTRILTLWDEHREALSAVQHDTAHLAARVETALESLYDTLQADAPASPKKKSTGRADGASASASTDEDPDAAWQAMQAEALLDQLRAQLKADEAAPPSSRGAADKAKGNPETDDPSAPDDGLPEKTIGRPRSAHD